MESTLILYLILGILIINYGWEQYLDYLNLSHQKDQVPDQLQDICDQATYEKTLNYQRARTNFGFLTAAASFLVILLLLISGFFGLLDHWLRIYFHNPILLALVYFGVLYLAADVLSLPFQWYNTFVLEEKFGFNNTTKRIFFLDKLKGYLIAAVVGGPLLWLLLYLIDQLGPNFWIYFLVVIACFSLLINMFYTSLILPIFNKLTPLPEGELKSAIETYSRAVDFPLDNIYVIDGSKRSSKSNAFFSGLGKKKKIVLYDTLIENHQTEELVAILAHEVGHYKKKHIVQSFILSILQSALMLYLLSLMIGNEQLSLALGGSVLSIHLNLLAFGMLYTPISKILGVLFNLFSRKNEYEADAFAAKTSDGAALKSALKKLSIHNLSNLWPHRWFVFFHYSHPPIVERLQALDHQSI